MSLAREIVAARWVTSSIAARTADTPPLASIREIAVDGASSPARHCTRIARIAGGCTPSVRRLIASASRPVRLLMSVRFEIEDSGAIDALFLRHNMRQPDLGRSQLYQIGGRAWLGANLQARGNTARLHRSALRAPCADAKRAHSSLAGVEGRSRAASRQSPSAYPKRVRRARRCPANGAAKRHSRLSVV